MLIHPRARDLDERRELRVKVPLRWHVKLHSLKLLRNVPMADAIGEALEQYFARLEA